METCPRCNKTTTCIVVSSGDPFEGQYSFVCDDCVDDIDYKAAQRDLGAGIDVLFTFLCHYPSDHPDMIRKQRASRAVKKMGEIDDKRKKKGKR